KDPAKLLSSSATGFLDFARNDYLPLWERGVPLCRDDVRNTNGDQKKRKELAARERPDQFGIGLAESFDRDSKDRVTNQKQTGHNAGRLARARPHKPQTFESDGSLQQSF